jgi:hypothetical protein
MWSTQRQLKEETITGLETGKRKIHLAYFLFEIHIVKKLRNNNITTKKIALRGSGCYNNISNSTTS